MLRMLSLLIEVLSLLATHAAAGEAEQTVACGASERCFAGIEPSIPSEVLLQMTADYSSARSVTDQIPTSEVSEEQPAPLPHAATGLPKHTLQQSLAKYPDAVLSTLPQMHPPGHLRTGLTSLMQVVVESIMKSRGSSSLLALALCLSVALAFCGMAVLLAAVQGPIHHSDRHTGESLEAWSRSNPGTAMERPMLDRHKHDMQPRSQISPATPNKNVDHFAVPGHRHRDPVPAGARTPPTSRSPGPSQRAPGEHLCPGLVVPHGHKCELFVATLEALGLSGGKAKDTFDIQDHGGKPVISVEMSLPNWSAISRGTTSSADRKPLVLRTTTAPGKGPGQVLAMCEAHVDAQGLRSFFVLNNHGERFGQIITASSGCRYLSERSQQLFFKDEFRSYKYTISSDEGQRIAETQLDNVDFHKPGYYLLQVSSGHDVSVVLCGLLAIDLIRAR